MNRKALKAVAIDMLMWLLLSIIAGIVVVGGFFLLLILIHPVVGFLYVAGIVVVIAIDYARKVYKDNLE